jgi:hypothetical protein
VVKPFDSADLGSWEEVERALHGDLAPLVKLLRSEKPISKLARDYIADEIEREPDKRFRLRRRANLAVRDSDRTLLYRVFSAKVELALKKLGSDADDDLVWAEFDRISDREALDHLTEQYGLAVDEISLNNTLRRSAPGIFDPRGPRRRMKKIK